MKLPARLIQILKVNNKNIINNNPNVTIVMIAHRLDTLKNCDYILEIKDKKFIKNNNLNDYKSIKKQI